VSADTTQFGKQFHTLFVVFPQCLWVGWAMHTYAHRRMMMRDFLR